MDHFFPPLDLLDTFWPCHGPSPEDIMLGTRKLSRMGFLVSLSCGLIGAFIVARKLALMGDAISHGILPGLAIAFIDYPIKGIISHVHWCMRGRSAMQLCIEWFNKKTPLKMDAALGLHLPAFLL